MKMEHIALLVESPKLTADWYCEHMGFSVCRTKDDETETHFLEQPDSSVLIEIYKQPHINLPEYTKMDPAQLHLAFTVENIEVEIQRLVATGATIVEEAKSTPRGDRLAMLRDPWGFPLQLCKRP